MYKIVTVDSVNTIDRDYTCNSEISREYPKNGPVLLEKDKPIEKLQYTWQNASSLNIYGLPNGVTSSIDVSSNLISIEGTPVDTGTYVVTLSTNGCSDTITFSDTLKVVYDISTNVDEVVWHDAAVLVYPNPVNTKLHIEFESNKNTLTEIVVMDLSGHVLIEKSYHTKQYSNEIAIDVSTFSKGLYILNIRNSEFNKMVKFTKQAN
jgi:hypothetical protein